MSSQEHISIISPERSTDENDIRNAMASARRITRTVSSSIFYIDKNNPYPSNIVNAFCQEVFQNNASVVMSINYEQETSRATEFIADIASRLGYPVISWDPFYRSALEADDDNMILQLSSTIYHECKAMVLIMERYNWTEFTIVTTKDMGRDFIDCMDIMVKDTRIIQGYLEKEKYVKIATVILPAASGPYFDDLEKLQTKKELNELKRVKSRIVLLHASKEHAINIIEVAQEMGLVGQQYAWVLTASTVGDLSMSTVAASLPPGILGLSQNRSIGKVEEAIVISSRLVAEAVRKMPRDATLCPYYDCGTLSQNFTRWKTGIQLYKTLKGINLRPSSELIPERGRSRSSEIETRYPVSFTEYGVVANEELFLVNVRPQKEVGQRTFRRPVHQWNKVGRIYPKVENRETVLAIETNEIIWPGLQATPPIGRPEKRFFRLVTKEEKPFVMFVAPDAVTGKCGHHAVPCLVNAKSIENANITNENGTVDYCCTGFCIEILQVLADRMKFDYVIYEVPDGQWGIPDENGKWNGLVKEILD
ncbi:hypothetical protein DPMN_008288 [Dreissena polymorpha]|uniref:Ionotropic glutamate receptor L-glutamate and glycine-binding domain-containing protein n=1 Tax=Dreissena polymorpha TaxID=45954 RepID=A0A9D4RX67_DREPO|nr:hypothetical protein DPMN_008288 [Dreissena polymorpha]